MDSNFLSLRRAVRDRAKRLRRLAPSGLLTALALLASLLAADARPAFAAEGIDLPAFTQDVYTVLGIVFASGLICLGYGLFLQAGVLRQSPGSEKMQQVAGAIQAGAMAYLSKQVRAMIPLVLVLAFALFFLYQPIFDAKVAIGIALFFVVGVAASYTAGYAGMGMAVRGNVRTANAALSSFKQALEVAFRSGAVSGMYTVSLGLLGATIVFFLYREEAMKVLIGFGFGGSLAALFMRVGGGIFTKAADVGADLVGKVEAGIPEDDPRNPATIADNVGDNVGDCAGMAADVFESYEVTLVAAIILGAAVVSTTTTDPAVQASILKLILFPLLVRAVGVFASIIGIASVKGRDDADMDPMQPINRGFWVSSLVSIVLFGLVSFFYMNDITVPIIGAVPWWKFFAATLAGIILAQVIGKMTEYFTSTEYRPVTEIADATRTGPATLILSGFSYGLESAVWGVVAIALTLMASLILFAGNAALAAYGIALSGLGLLTTTGYILAMDTFGPISDNANGIFEMSGALEEAKDKPLPAGGISAHRIVHKLDAVGNTTKALTKGFAIATAVVAAVALFRSFMADAGLLYADNAAAGLAMSQGKIVGLPLDLPVVFIGLLIGGAAPFLFSSFAINAVSRAAILLVEEVRRQFREDPGIMAGTSLPDYARCVAISTAAAQKELLSPGILAVALPVLVGFGLGFDDPYKGAAALGGYLAGAIVSGQLLAVMLSNSGGAWDNAKKKIEDGMHGGKGTDAHKAAVIGDTVGDPFKDTAGPALNPLIKVMNLVAILIAPVIISPGLSDTVRLLVVLGALGALTFAILLSKKAALNIEQAAPVTPGPPPTPPPSSPT
ncbi:MAG TPA: sodium-translocating pyrophosphatase, partial [Armatimonadaceae bacterium]|nr:sodium-translocating pyrophosphatase [Armatimonadaceae bacterium]